MRSAPQRKRETGLFKEVWVAYNNLVEFCREIAPIQSGNQGVQVERKSNGTSFRVSPANQATGNARVVRMRVTSVLDDKLVCTNLEDGQSVNVAKDFNLRKTGWHGQTIVYTLEPYPNAPATLTVSYDMPTATYRRATIGGYVEHQVIRPIFKLGLSEIFAAACEDTGVSGCDWVDINADARAWTMVQ
jgi:hypothetical protein